MKKNITTSTTATSSSAHTSDYLSSSSRHLRQLVVSYIAFRNLFYRRMRTILTVCGVMIGVGAILFLVSFAVGLRNLVTNEVVGSKSVNQVDITTPKPNTIKLTDQQISQIQNFPHVKSITKTYTFAGRVTFNQATTDVVVYGADKGYLDLLSLNFVRGNKGSINGDTSIVINTAFLKILGVAGPADAIDKTLLLKVERENPDDQGNKFTEKKLIVKAVVETGSGAEIYTDDGLWTNSGFTRYSQAKVVVDNQGSIAQVRKQIESLGFTTTSPIDTLEQINSVFGIFTFILAGFGGIGLLVAVLGMFNTLTISLLERTKEIGLMSALGARQADVRRIFLTEAVMISVIGGVLAIIGTIMLGGMLNAVFSALAKSRGVEGNISIFVLPWWSSIVAIVFCALIGILVAVYPVFHSTRRSPIDALRFE